MSMEVRLITAADAKPWIMQEHYLRCMVGAVHHFGLFEDGLLVGVVLYGMTAFS
jgi:hypothetical protein